MNFKSIIVFLCLTSPAAAADKLVKVISGSGGDLQISRLYSVDYQCKVDTSHQFGLVQKALGLWDAGWSKGTVNENVSVYSTSPANAPTTTGATGSGANAPAGSANGSSFQHKRDDICDHAITRYGRQKHRLPWTILH